MHEADNNPRFVVETNRDLRTLRLTRTMKNAEQSSAPVFIKQRAQVDQVTAAAGEGYRVVSRIDDLSYRRCAYAEASDGIAPHFLARTTGFIQLAIPDWPIL